MPVSIKQFLLIVAALNSLLIGCIAFAAEQKVSLQLFWKHQFEFAGYYAAKEKGFYKDVGVDVQIKEYDFGMNVTSEVLSGKSEFGTSSSSGIADILNDKGVELIANIFKHSSLVLLSTQDLKIRHPNDLLNKKIMLTEEEKSSSELLYFLAKNNIKMEQLNIIPHTFDVMDIVNKKVDIMTAYITNQPYTLKEKGIPYSIMDPANYGADFYGDFLFTSKKLVKEKPELVKNFKEASLKGWKYALENQEEIIELILKRYNTQNKSKAALQYEAKETYNLILPEVFPLGSIDNGKILRIAEIMQQTGLIDKNINLKLKLLKREDDVPKIPLTSKEKAWLKNHSVVKVGGELDWAPFDFVKDGKYQGISKEIIDLIAKKTGLNIKYVTGQTWIELVEDFKTGKLDILPAYYHTQSREEYSSFSKPYFKIKDYVFARKDDNSIKSIADLKNKKVAVIDGYAVIEHLKNKFPNIKLIKVESLSAGIDAVLLHQADVYIDAYPTMMYTLSSTMQTGLKPVLPLNFYSNDLHIGINKLKPILASIVQKALQAVTIEEKNNIFEKWTAIDEKKTTILLTEKEKTWLEEHPIIKVANDSEWPPFDFYENGKAKGYSMDYLRALANIIGIRLEFVQDENWDKLINQFKTKKLDIITAYEETPENKQFALFTTPFLSTFESIIIRKETPFLKDYKDLYGKKVAVITGYDYEEVIKTSHPEIKMILVDTAVEGLKKLSYSQVDAFLENSSVVDYLIKKHRFVNLQLAGDASFPNMEVGDQIKIAIRKDWPELHGLLLKAMKAIPENTLDKLNKKWLASGEKGIEKKILLSKEEKAWIKANPVFKVANEMDWPPFDYNEAGNPLGLSIDYIQLIAKKIGIKPEFVNNHTWAELTSLYQKNEIDVMPAYYKNDKRKIFSFFTNAYYKGTLGIFIRQNEPNIKKFQDLNDKKTGIQKGDASIPIIKRLFPKLKLIEIDSNVELVKQLAIKKLDAIIGNPLIYNYYAKENQVSNIRLFDYIPLSENEQKSMSLYIGIHKNKPMLYQLIQKGFQSLTSEEINTIKDRWLYIKRKNPKMIQNLSEKERTWLSQKKTIRYVYDPNWPPFEWTNEFEKHTGMIYDILNLISNRTGIVFEAVSVEKWSDAIKLAEDKQVDMYSAINLTIEKQQYMRFTQNSIYETPYVFVVRKEDTHDYFDAFKAIQNKKIGVVQGYSIHDTLKNEKPEIPLKLADSPRAAFEMLQNKSIDVFIVNAATAKYYINKQGFDDFKIATKTNYVLKPKIAIRKDWPKEVISIIDKGMESITDEELSAIQVKWTEATIVEKIDYSLVWKIVVFMLFLFIIFAYYNRRINLQKQFVQTLLDSQEQIIVTTDGKTIRSVNTAFLKFYAVASISEFTKQYHAKCICNTFNTNAPEGYLQMMMGDEKWIDYVIHYSSEKNHKALITQEKNDHTFSVTGAKLPGTKGLKSAVFTNITDMENAKKVIEEIHKHTRESIEYASLIQGALIPDNEIFNKYFQDSFAIWHPKDIVGGDIYLAQELTQDEILIMVIDCTGHGVPGAFVTMLVKAVERQIIANIHKDEIVSPAKILSIFNKNIRNLLKQENVDSISNAGFDGGILYYNKKEKLIRFSGAETPLFYVENDVIKAIKGSRHSIGYKKSDPDYVFKEHTITCTPGMQFYLTTDGYLDQNGGDDDYPFGKKRFKNLISEIYQKSMAEQQELLLYELQNYQKDEERNDDVTMIGLNI